MLMHGLVVPAVAWDMRSSHLITCVDRLLWLLLLLLLQAHLLAARP
jgi:hypothetical protein